MTTIAYRDGILAVDRQMVHGHFARPTDMKLHKIKSVEGIEYAFAFSGTIIMGLAYVEWIEKGMPRGDFPIKDINKERSFYSLLVKRFFDTDATVRPEVQYFDNDLIGMSEDEVPWAAQGSGDEFALGAMFHGATAIEAVQAANAQCAWSGYGVNYIDVAGDFQIKRLKIARVE